MSIILFQIDYFQMEKEPTFRIEQFDLNSIKNIGSGSFAETFKLRFLEDSIGNGVFAVKKPKSGEHTQKTTPEQKEVGPKRGR